jgi:hypothetical protein
MQTNSFKPALSAFRRHFRRMVMTAHGMNGGEETSHHSETLMTSPAIVLRQQLDVRPRIFPPVIFWWQRRLTLAKKPSSS